MDSLIGNELDKQVPGQKPESRLFRLHLILPAVYTVVFAIAVMINVMSDFNGLILVILAAFPVSLFMDPIVEAVEALPLPGVFWGSFSYHCFITSAAFHFGLPSGSSRASQGSSRGGVNDSTPRRQDTVAYGRRAGTIKVLNRA